MGSVLTLGRYCQNQTELLGLAGVRELVWGQPHGFAVRGNPRFGVRLKTPQDAEGVVTTDIREPGSSLRRNPEPTVLAPDLSLPNGEKQISVANKLYPFHGISL